MKGEDKEVGSANSKFTIAFFHPIRAHMRRINISFAENCMLNFEINKIILV